MNYRRELIVVCLILAFAASVVYDTWYVTTVAGLRTVMAVAVVACFGAIFVLARYPQSMIQSALLAAWPLHLFTICFLGLSYCFYGGAQVGAAIAYTIVAYATYLLIPVCLMLDHRLFDAFTRIVAIGSAVLAVPSYMGAMGVNSILSIPLSNKYSYSRFSGLIASGGVFEYPEGHALQMGVGLFCCWYALRRTGRPLYVVCLVMILAGLVLSQGRGAIFGVVIACAFCLLPAFFRRLPLVFLGAFAVCLLFPFLIWPQLAELPGVADYLRIERGLSGREAAWPYAISLVKEKPWIGHGFGSSAELSEAGERLLRRSGYSGAGTTFHNTFITKAVELGIITASIYALMYIVSLVRICRPTHDVLQQQLVRSVLVLAVTASIFRDYNIGGVRSTSVMTAVFLGLANLWPLAAQFAKSSQDAVAKATLSGETAHRSQVVSC